MQSLGSSGPTGITDIEEWSKLIKMVNNDGYCTGHRRLYKYASASKTLPDLPIENAYDHDK